METVLLAVTIGSLLVALIMSAAAWRMSREERARSAARIAALAAAASDAAAPEATPTIHQVEKEPRLVEPAEPRAPWTTARIPSPAPRPSVVQRSVGSSERGAVAHAARVPDLVLNAASAAEELPLRPAPRAIEPVVETAPIADSFLGGAFERQHGGRQRGLAAAAAVLFVLLGGGAYWALSDDSSAAASVAAARSTPLELISMRHERQGPRLSVSGLVRNPGAGSPIDGLTAVVFLFDQSGAFLTSAKAGVDFKRLAPGDESPFVIAFDAPSSVARYRVSFRTDAGIVAHVDRRGQEPVATAVVGK